MNTLTVCASARSDAIYVVATTMTGTEAALRFAVSLARQRNARLVLVVPQVSHELVPGGAISRTKPWLVARYERIARTFDQRIQVLSCVSTSDVVAARQLTPPCATTVVGGRHRWWWPQPEERVAVALRRSGRHVAYVPETADISALLSQFDTHR
jgi:hypothetical protein